MGSPDRPPKQEAFLALLAEGWTSLHLDARRDGVIVPAHLKGEPHLVLQYGHDLPIPIPDLTVNEQGVSATLSFARTPSTTVIPWSAVYVVTAVDGRGVLYQEDIPSDVSVIAASAGDAPRTADGTQAAGGPADEAPEMGEGAVPAEAPRAATPSRALRAVPLSGPISDDPTVNLDLIGGAPPEELVPARRRKRPQLRLVK
jgi:stringent starvation protein B